MPLFLTDFDIKCKFHHFRSKVKVTDAFLEKNCVMDVTLYCELILI